MALKATKGKVFEVSISGEPCEACAKISKDGFVGDRTGTTGIVILSREVITGIDEKYYPLVLQESIMPGTVGDNILTEGLGNLSELKQGDLVRIGQKVELVILSPALHYRKMKPHFPKEVLDILMDFGGHNCSVLKGVGEYVWDDDEIEILPREELKGAA